MPTSVDLSHNWFGLPCGYTLSRLRKAQDGASLSMYPSVAFSFYTHGYVRDGVCLAMHLSFGFPNPASPRAINYSFVNREVFCSRLSHV